MFVKSKVLWMKDYDHDNHSFVMGYRTGILIMVLIYHYHLMYYIQLLSSSLLFRVMMIIFLKQHFQQ